MRDELSDIFGTFMPEPSHEDPVRRAQIQMKNPLAKRFYKQVGSGDDNGRFTIELDGRTVKTPAKKLLTDAATHLQTHFGRLDPPLQTLLRLRQGPGPHAIDLPLDGGSDTLRASTL